MSDSVSVRQNEILKLLIQQGSVRAAELTELFQVTSETIRKDLNHLGELGYIERRHGGAVLSEAYRQEYVYSESKASFRRGKSRRSRSRPCAMWRTTASSIWMAEQRYAS